MTPPKMCKVFFQISRIYSLNVFKFLILMSSEHCELNMLDILYIITFYLLRKLFHNYYNFNAWWYIRKKMWKKTFKIKHGHIHIWWTYYFSIHSSSKLYIRSNLGIITIVRFIMFIAFYFGFTAWLLLKSTFGGTFWHFICTKAIVLWG